MNGLVGRRAVWIGADKGPELSAARSAVAARMDLADLPSEPAEGLPIALEGIEPLIAFLGLDAPARFTPEHTFTIARRWPLCRIVAVASSLAEGRRRSGPPLPGVEEIPWHEIAGRLDRWLADLAEGRPGTLGLPPTVRREDRLLEATPLLGDSASARTVSLAAATHDDLEGLAGLLAELGGPPLEKFVGRPSIDAQGDVVFWDCGVSITRHLPWLRLLAANRPAADIVILESFPRGDRTRAAIDAGAACVLGRPASAEAIAGTLNWLATRQRTGVGGYRPPR